MKRRRVIGTVLLLFLTVVPIGIAQGAAIGGEFRVNTHTTDNQVWTSAAMDENGNFIITWDSEDQDGSERGVYAQLYDSSGTPVGTEFQVNTHTTDDQSWPSAAMDADGDFIITWRSYEQDGSGWGVYAQLFLTVSSVIDDIHDTIDNHGLANSLTTLLSNALNALNNGNMHSFEGFLTAFIRHVTGLSGNQIDTEYANTLIQWAQAWLEESGQV